MDFKELAENLGLEEEEYKELIELFIMSGRSDLENLQTAIEAGDSGEAASAIHSLKGAAGNLGLSDFYEAAKKIEADIREGSLEGVVESVQALMMSLEKIASLA